MGAYSQTTFKRADQFLTLQQNLHLMHHLWASFLFYHYARLYLASLLLLRVEGVRIEGLRLGSQVVGRDRVQIVDGRLSFGQDRLVDVEEALDAA